MSTCVTCRSRSIDVAYKERAVAKLARLAARQQDPSPRILALLSDAQDVLRDGRLVAAEHAATHSAGAA